MAATTKSGAKAAKAGSKATAKSSAERAATKATKTTKTPAEKAPAKAAKGPAAKGGKAPAKKAPAKKATGKAPAPQAPARKAPAKKAKGGTLDKFLQDQLAALQSERVVYLNQATSLRAEADLLAAEREPGDVQFDEESGEGDTLAVERERDLALSAQAQAAVEEIDLAIAKIHDGTYGICEQCGASIPKERLRALPHAALCVQCKSAGFSRR